MSFRKERKYSLTFFELNNLKYNLIKNGMKKIYDRRCINSLYYDTKFENMFFHSEEGVVPRKKIRIRWYDSNSIFRVEKKITSNEGRYKTTKIVQLDSKEKFPKTILDKQYGILTPSLLVSYERDYYMLKGARITFDTSIKYQNYRTLSKNKFIDNEQVMELKVGKDTNDDYIESVIPYSTKRFSKYSRGLLISQGKI